MVLEVQHPMETGNTLQEAKSETRVLSQKRPRVALSPSSHAQDQLFSLEREKATIPKKLQNKRDLAVLEQILQYIASKKKEGV